MCCTSGKQRSFLYQDKEAAMACELCGTMKSFGMRFCRDCGAEVNERYKHQVYFYFCDKCPRDSGLFAEGVSERAAQDRPQPHEIHCPNCGAKTKHLKEVQIGVSFCESFAGAVPV